MNNKKTNTSDVGQEMNLPTMRQKEEELRFYDRVKQSAKSEPIKWDLNCVGNRVINKHYEEVANFPQNLFFIRYKNRIIFGRKTISEKHLAGELMELHCCQILPHMLLGLLCDEKVSQNGITIYYNPFYGNEKLAFFKSLYLNTSINISHKYVFLIGKQKKERSSPKAGWKLDIKRGKNLLSGEAILRKYTLHFLSFFSLEKKVIYDPACSTGDFLFTIKQQYPKCKTIGQDLSKAMINYVKAQGKADASYHLDAMFSPIEGPFADFIFIRFLNSEVVTRDQALLLYEKIVSRSKPGAYIIVFGHTPVLLSIYDLIENDSLKLIQSTAHMDGAIFQYYVVQRIKKTDKNESNTFGMFDKYLHGSSRVQEAERLLEQSRGAEKFLWENFSLKELINAEKVNTPFLEIGCGVGAQTVHLISRLPEGLSVHCIDIDPGQISKAKEKINVNKALAARVSYEVLDVTKANWGQNTISGAYISWVLEHIGNEAAIQLLSKLRIAMQAGGVIIVNEIVMAPVVGMNVIDKEGNFPKMTRKFLETMIYYQQINGGDPNYGLKENMVSAFSKAGFEDFSFRRIEMKYPPTALLASRKAAIKMFDGVRENLVSKGLFVASDYSTVINEINNTKDIIWSCGQVVACVGEKIDEKLNYYDESVQ